LRVFGKHPSGKRLERLKKSSNYRDKAFTNLEITDIISKKISSFTLMKAFFNKPKSVSPSGRIPSVNNNLKESTFKKPTVVWFGHSSYAIFTGSLSILVDPVLKANASPFRFFGKPFAGSDIYSINDLPFINLVLITHDHYDHLCYSNIRDLRDKCDRFIVPLGVGEHLEYWGVEPGKIRELDWWQQEVVNKEISVTATPSRHFSGRMLTRNKTLWCSYVLMINKFKLYLGGDSGYGIHYKRIGERYGPFDFALLECGQYGIGWPQIHMVPEETAAAAADLQAEVFMPVHWGRFALSLHPWNESIKRVFAAAKALKLNINVPGIGDCYEIGSPVKQMEWWDFH